MDVASPHDPVLPQAPVDHPIPQPTVAEPEPPTIHMDPATPHSPPSGPEIPAKRVKTTKKDGTKTGVYNTRSVYVLIVKSTDAESRTSFAGGSKYSGKYTSSSSRR
jgi:hypothetical protein